ncbi:AGE family epimerase/isomerase [Breoghania sp. L-A4]|uniref:AGE family epimerase/isomerase n=1 Tax=Breoghania sp. L-A4 TaxID=2304600 RepID=UPI0013C2E740|nr:AGE family epimerase/isomerase [Breoghania sp. L-A4]
MTDTQYMPDLHVAAARLTRWLFDEALPVWTRAGVNPGTGAFVEAIALEDGTPSSASHRGFVQPRQIYSVIEAGRLGWTGDWRAISTRALDWYLAHFLRDDGTIAHLVSADGAIESSRFDLYDQAFSMFALASAADAFPERRGRYEAAAEDLLKAVERGYRHPHAGFQESNPPSVPLRANPTCICWRRHSPGTRPAADPGGPRLPMRSWN